MPAALAGARLDQALAQLLPQHSRNRLKGWIEAGQVMVGAAIVVSPRHKLHGGETVAVIEVPAAADARVAAQAIPLAIVYEDDALLVLDKPAGLVVHPGAGNRRRHAGRTCAAAITRPRWPRCRRAGIVHRLDKDTSGLIVVAKTETAQVDLVRQLAARTVKREYVAGRVRRPGARDDDRRADRAPPDAAHRDGRRHGRQARAHARRRLERFGAATLVQCRLETGRTHQIRVHLTALGHPLLGDPTYRGRRKPGLTLPAAAYSFPRQALHARRLGSFIPSRAHRCNGNRRHRPISRR